MKRLSIRNADSLYWIGRYLQRFSIISRESIKAFDSIIDSNFDEGKELFEKIGYSIDYTHANDFFHKITKYMNEGSLYSYITAARENAIAIRDIIDDDLFAPINISYTRLNTHPNPSVKFLENTLNEMYSFWGIIAIKTVKNRAYGLLEFGQIVETIDLKLRLFEDISMVLFDIERLNRVGETIYPAFSPIAVHHSSVDRLVDTINTSIGQIIHYES